MEGDIRIPVRWERNVIADAVKNRAGHTSLYFRDGKTAEFVKENFDLEKLNSKAVAALEGPAYPDHIDVDECMKPAVPDVSPGTYETVGKITSVIETENGLSVHGYMNNRLSEMLQAEKDDPVNPSHYKSHPSGVECIEVARHMTFNCGNVVKYLWRAGLKEGQPDIQDLKKALWYLQDEIAMREESA